MSFLKFMLASLRCWILNYLIADCMSQVLSLTDSLRSGRFAD
jgi:hypothetical protein